MRVKRRLIRLASRALVGVGQRLSPRLAVQIADRLGRRVKMDPRLNKRQLRDNLRHFFPDRDDAWILETARSIQSNALRARLLDKHFLPRIKTGELDRMVVPVDWRFPQLALDSGRGVVFVSMHYGRFWAAPVWFSRHGFMPSAFQSSAGRLPDETETLAGGSLNAADPKAALRSVRALKSGSFLFLLLDAGKIRNPITVDFLGHPTHFSPAAIRLARAADALIVPGLVPVDPADPERVRMTFYDAIDLRDVPEDEPVETTMRRILEPIERQVAADPSQWYGALNAHRRLARPGGAGEKEETPQQP